VPSGRKQLRAYLQEQAVQLIARDVASDPDVEAVHDVRVAGRRIRSIARVFDVVLDPDAAGHIDTEVAWYQDLLGAMRDAQLQRERLIAAFDELDPVDVRGPVRERITRHLTTQHDDAHRALVAAMASGRYRTMLADVAAFAGGPPLDAGASTSELRKRVARAHAKAARRLRAAVRADDATLLHRARKATKRVRYATEALRATIGEDSASAAISRYRQVQDVLGAHQDAVLAIALLEHLAATAARAGEDEHSYRVLADVEQEACRSARAAAHGLSL
jgi:CHAD domain-containing protein